MIKTDYHLHSNFSSDSQASPESMIESAIDMGLETICFTDHMDLAYVKPESGGHDFTFDLDEYFARLIKLQEKHKNNLEILIGIELGLQTDIVDQLKSLVEKYPFDFIIGSTHLVDKLDPYYKDFWTSNSEEEGIRKYFQATIDNIKAFQGFHVYGHLDYIVRYAPNQGNGNYKYNYENYKDIIDELLNTLIHYGKGLEVNTSGLKYGLGYAHPKLELIKKYKKLGGEIITIGSDAHAPEHLAYDFPLARDLIKTAGFDYYTIYREGKSEFIKL